MFASKRWKTISLSALLSLTSLSVASGLQDRAVSTTVVQVTATTTITQTATNSANAQGACDNFYGACVVYIGYGDPSYTTTFYNYAPSTTTTTTTPTSTSIPTPTTVVTSYSTHTVVVQTTTVSNQGECSDYNGACVVYETAGGAAATTVYAGSNSGQRPGHPGGYIGLTGNGNGDGAIGAGASLDRRRSACWALFGILLGCASVFL